MTPKDYLLIGIGTVLSAAGWTLWHAYRCAKDGYEDLLGFHGSSVPVLTLRMEASIVGVEGLVAAMPVKRRRRSGNSRPPMNVASASPFEQPAPKRRRTQRVDSTPPIAVSTQAIINQIMGQEPAP
jgi:hypothetical protein